MIRLQEQAPEISVTPGFDWYHGIDAFLKGEYDICFAFKEDISHIPDIQMHPLFDSRIYLVTLQNDPLAQKQKIRENDLAGRTLMVGGPSQGPLQKGTRHTRVLIRDKSTEIPRAFRFSGVVICARLAKVKPPSSVVNA